MNDSKDHKAAAEPPLDCNVVREALRELVLLKDLHDEIEKLLPGSVLRLDMERIYRERKPAAWASARAALAHNNRI